MNNIGVSYIFPTQNLFFCIPKRKKSFLIFYCPNMFCNFFNLLVVQVCFNFNRSVFFPSVVGFQFLFIVARKDKGYYFSLLNLKTRQPTCGLCWKMICLYLKSVYYSGSGSNVSVCLLGPFFLQCSLRPMFSYWSVYC